MHGLNEKGLERCLNLVIESLLEKNRKNQILIKQKVNLKFAEIAILLMAKTFKHNFFLRNVKTTDYNTSLDILVDPRS